MILKGKKFRDIGGDEIYADQTTATFEFSGGLQGLGDTARHIGVQEWKGGHPRSFPGNLERSSGVSDGKNQNGKGSHGRNGVGEGRGTGKTLRMAGHKVNDGTKGR